MRALYVFFILLATGAVLAGGWYATRSAEINFTDIEVGFGDTGILSVVPEDVLSTTTQSLILESIGGRIPWAQYWQPFSSEEEKIYGSFVREPEPLRVGLQAGHYQNDDVPQELEGLKRNGGGAQGGGYSEVEVVLDIATRVKTLLEAQGIIVDLLPATVPVDYQADAFVSIHADGNNNVDVNGFKISGPRRDFSGKAQALVEVLYASYGAATGLSQDSNVTRRMSSYYAFNWRRYDHAVHPMIPAVIIETGFLTSSKDRAVIALAPQRAASGIAQGILQFLAAQ